MKLSEVYWFHVVHLSVCLSICPFICRPVCVCSLFSTILTGSISYHIYTSAQFFFTYQLSTSCSGLFWVAWGVGYSQNASILVAPVVSAKVLYQISNMIVLPSGATKLESAYTLKSQQKADIFFKCIFLINN